MRDRIPTKVLDNGAVRYAVYDEKGALLRYEYMLPADEPADGGTPLSKGTIMTDDVEALIWGAAADRTVNDAFGKMSELYQHWWSILHGQAYSYYEQVKTPVTATSLSNNSQAYLTIGSDIKYSKEISISTSGAVSLVNPTTLSFDTNTNNFAKRIIALAPVYVSNIFNNTSAIIYIPSGATHIHYTRNFSGYDENGYTLVSCVDNEEYFVRCGFNAPVVAQVVSSKRIDVPAGETTYEHSPDRNAYPDSGTVDGLTYTYLGLPFENARQGGKIETGSYKGTAKYGSSNKNTLTFSFVPKLVIINGGAYGGYWTANSTYLVVNTTSDGVSNSVCTASLSGKTLSWYSGAHSSNQLNNSTTYYYVAIG